MEVDSLRREVTSLKADKANLQVKSKLFENFAAMAHSCCRLPSTAEWESLKKTLQDTLDFSIELTGADSGYLVLLDSNGVVSDSVQSPENSGRTRCCGLKDHPLEAGLAGWVRGHHQVGVIADTRDDERWTALPHQPQTVRSVLAIPILKCDELLGVLTLLHLQPNHFSPEAVDQMKATSDQIAMTLENARLYGQLNESYQSLDQSKQEIEAYSKALDEELEKGRQIQRDFLPQNIPQLPNWDISTYFAPAKQVSGDFYDVFSLPGDNLGVVIADVADKGVGSALYMALIRSLIRVFSGHISLHGFANFSINNGVSKSVAEQCATTDQLNALTAVKLTNDYIAHEHAKEGMFATLFFGVINPLNGIMAYINGGHEPLVISNSAGIKQNLEPTGPAVGMLVDMKFEIRQVQIDPGDILIGYTDGVIEALAPNGDFFTRQRLLSTIKQSASSASALVEGIKRKLLTHVHNAPPSDDITMLAIRRLS
ncbi:Serine phosphatase RsbU, regulator of sigma subunit [Olavius algarvensis Delta 1 endosymbiont]|nr:Serine phosphatase RsbU, regulator of sigma subunit [Olavius algarvensis Delta 1 endosymbiont]